MKIDYIGNDAQGEYGRQITNAWVEIIEETRDLPIDALLARAEELLKTGCSLLPFSDTIARKLRPVTVYNWIRGNLDISALPEWIQEEISWIIEHDGMDAPDAVQELDHRMHGRMFLQIITCEQCSHQFAFTADVKYWHRGGAFPDEYRYIPCPVCAGEARKDARRA